MGFGMPPLLPFATFFLRLVTESDSLLPFTTFFLSSVTESDSLLPFTAFFLVLGHRERFSVTFLRFFSCARSQRTLHSVHPPFNLNRTSSITIKKLPTKSLFLRLLTAKGDKSPLYLLFISSTNNLLTICGFACPFVAFIN